MGPFEVNFLNGFKKSMEILLLTNFDSVEKLTRISFFGFFGLLQKLRTQEQFIGINSKTLLVVYFLLFWDSLPGENFIVYTPKQNTIVTNLYDNGS